MYNRISYIIYFVVVFLVFVINPAYATVGVTATNDCENTLVMQSVLPAIYQPGYLPPATSCQHPNVASTVQDLRSGDFGPGNASGFITFCTASLINNDNDKLVFISASHCPDVPAQGMYPTWMTFEPQSSIPYSSATFGSETRQPVRPYSATQHLIPVSAIIIHPSSAFVGGKITGKKDFVSADIVLYVVDKASKGYKQLSNEDKAYIESIPVKNVPRQVGYLDQFTSQQLSNASWVGVGINRLVPSLYCEPDNPAPSCGTAQAPNVPAHHNRNYAKLDFGNLSLDTITLHGHVNQEDNNICNGDSGGPLLFTDPNTSKEYIVGIESIGNGCVKGWLVEGRTDSRLSVPFIECAFVTATTVGGKTVPGDSAAVRKCVDSATYPKN